MEGKHAQIYCMATFLNVLGKDQIRDKIFALALSFVINLSSKVQSKCSKYVIPLWIYDFSYIIA